MKEDTEVYPYSTNFREGMETMDNWITQRWERKTRYYVAQLQPDLWESTKMSGV